MRVINIDRSLNEKKPPETQATGQHQARGKQVDAPTSGNFHFYPRTCKKKKNLGKSGPDFSELDEE